jgi:hypothetical protein
MDNDRDGAEFALSDATPDTRRWFTLLASLKRAHGAIQEGDITANP